MASRQRKTIAGTTKQYADAMGISERTARRHLKSGKVKGARKIGPHWVVPLTTTQYAKATGVSPRTARRRSTPAEKTLTKSWAAKNDIRKLAKIPAPIAGVQKSYAWRWWAWVEYTDDKTPKEAMISPGSVRIEADKIPTRPQFVRLITAAVNAYMGSQDNYEGRTFDIKYVGVIPWRTGA